MYYGDVVRHADGKLYVTVPFPEADAWLLEKQGVQQVEVKLLDSRTISARQRKKLYALFRDVSHWSGHIPDEVKELMKADFIAKTGTPEFSLSDTDMTTGKQLIDHIVAFCLEWDIPCRDTLLNHAEDIGRYLYLCLAHRKCCICGKRAHVHHVDRIGMGANRNEVCHIGYEAMALCWKHHREAHEVSKADFNRRYHIYGIRLDEFLCRKLGLKGVAA